MIGEVKTFIDSHVTNTPLHGTTFNRMELAHNDVWALRQLVDAAAQREQQLEKSLQAYVDFAAMRRRELGELSPEMEAVDLMARGALAGNPHQPDTLAFYVWQRGYTGLSFGGHEGSVAHGWHTAGAEAKYQQQMSRR
jgi:hypothetical protein